MKERRLAAIMFTDIVGYTAMMQQDEQNAVAVIKHFYTALKKWIHKYNGEILNDYGDGSLCIFSNARDAANCSLVLQKELRKDQVVPLRIALHIGEIFYEDSKVLGDGVNVASRIQVIGEENTILVSEEFHDKIKNNTTFSAIFLGFYEFKNVEKSIGIFALTNEGLFVPDKKKTKSKLKKNNSPIRNIIALLLLLASAAFIGLIYKNIPSGNDRSLPSENSIVVLPFVDISPEKDQEYLGDGLTDELISSIAVIKDLRVIGRISSFQLKGKELDVREIGEKLKVGFILEGSIQKTGETLRIITHLIRVKDNSTIWSQHFDNKLEDIFSIQDTIAQNIVRMLKLTVSDSEELQLIKKETDPEVYSLFLKGLYTYKENNFEKSIEYNRMAIRMDSLYAPPYAYIALSRIWMINRSHTYQDYIAISEAKDYANRSITLDPDLAVGYSAIGLLAWTIELDFLTAKNNFEKSIQLNPSASLIKNRYAYFLLWMGDFKKAEALGLEAIYSDPVDFNGYVIVSNARIYAKKFDKAMESISEGKKLFPENPQFEQLKILQQFYVGNYGQIIQTLEPLVLENSLEVSESLLSFLSIAYLKTGKVNESRHLLSLLNEKPENINSSNEYCLARIYLQYDKKDSCFFHLEKSMNNREIMFRFLKIDPLFQSIRKDPRYLQLYHRYGFDRYK